MNSVDLQQLEAVIKKALANVITRDDAKNFATKQDLESSLTKFATKDDLSAFATKDDLESSLVGFATKDDLKAFATKDDLDKMQDSIIQEMDSLISDYVQILDQKKSNKIDVTELSDRVTRIEEKIAA